MVGVGGAEGFVDIPEFDASMYVSDEVAPSARSQLVSVDSRGIRVHRQCAAAEPIALKRAGLQGPPDIFRARYDCEVKPRSVLIRVRATVKASRRWTRGRPAHLVLETPVSRAELSVQTPSRRPIGYVTIAAKKVRLWVSPDCVRD